MDGLDIKLKKTKFKFWSLFYVVFSEGKRVVLALILIRAGGRNYFSFALWSVSSHRKVERYEHWGWGGWSFLGPTAR